MTWVKLDDGYYTNPKAIAVGLHGRALHLASICWASANLSDGHIPRQVLPVLAVLSGVKGPATAALLVDAGLWAATDDGWQIKDYLEFNPTAEKVKADRAAAAERQRNAREAAAKKKPGAASVTDMSQRDSRSDSGVSHGGSHGPKTRQDKTTTPPDVSNSSDDYDYAVPPDPSSSSDYERTLDLITAGLAHQAFKTAHGGWKNSTRRNQAAENGPAIVAALAAGDDPMTIAARYCDPVHLRVSQTGAPT